MLVSLLKTRRSIRRFKVQPVEPEKLQTILEAALRAPSSRGLNPWEFVVVTDKQMLKKLAVAKPHGASFLAQAAIGIVVCADPRKCDVWVEDASIASILIHLAAHDAGLGSCWIQIRKRMHDREQTAGAYVAQLLQLPAQTEVESIVAIGYPDEKKSAHPFESLPHNKLHAEQYGRAFDLV